ncbi:MAG: phosphoribosylanthranilate isomerase [Methanothermococcus sp.]|jgi:phosphoribosylanthranilate isomerase|uniref:phosphoribosylanthranilate isomerase n=1 Tax=Methanothermococcus TaxID=155862 RepID=UPI00035F2DEA|nr:MULTISPECIES: phosphoribosylanthranilate isomerase [Methanothermococcus]MDK2790880.1 phosphoribosylanthranilate isomerase [Methanothermococcus sp.]MDK2987833.1 phosphoribosylanthranilate isomerase [Methanothermococcus sp.]
MFIKICGIKSHDELKIVEKYADATGVIVESESKRTIDLDKAKELIETSKIPVFTVSTLSDFEGWANVIKETGTKYIQIHSNMKPTDVERIKDEYDVFIMKAFKVPKMSSAPEKDAEDLINEIEEYNDIVDRVLLDTGKGCGITHDHRISKMVCEKFNVVLAGGLNPENVMEITEYVQPFGVDVSSGVEKDNKKDEDLIKSFVKNLNINKI